MSTDVVPDPEVVLVTVYRLAFDLLRAGLVTAVRHDPRFCRFLGCVCPTCGACVEAPHHRPHRRPRWARRWR